ncbi:hypothetical protein C1L07_004637 [Salmonella enterica subsp. enterica serovar Anatum]|nr:hypothetical protein [Salmonella enterica]ECX3460455.1 hypothetical protein [Salmonella enterica subsp. enterica serovar Litchfield]EDU1140978.1 hypothetical protein [Salmonella enterica subsp. enterica serovar Anatum]EDW4359097.1 hypothetical protein [Salmonella enterica subsp. salamae]EEE0306474.1 hypothetical protein [Salmonella enterica subsp. enterica serovar Oranienburg]
MSDDKNVQNLSVDFEKSLSAFCNWSLEKDKYGKYIDKNTQYAWSEYLRINCLNEIRSNK